MLGEYISEKGDDPSRLPANELPIDGRPRDGSSGRVADHLVTSGTIRDVNDFFFRENTVYDGFENDYVDNRIIRSYSDVFLLNTSSI